MKIRIFQVIFPLLLVLSFCMPLLALTEEEAKDAYIEADHAWDLANNERQTAFEGYGLANDGLGILSSMKSIAEYASADNTEDLIKDLVDILDAVGLDLLDVVTDASAALIKGVQDGVDWFTLRSQLSEIRSAYTAELANVANLQSAWESAKTKADALLEKKVEAFNIWQELKKPVTASLEPTNGSYTCFYGDSHLAKLTLSRGYSEVTWSYQPPSTATGLKTARNTSSGSGKSTESYGYFHPSSTGDWVITAEAKIAGSGEEVSASYTLTVLPTGISFNKIEFEYHETLVVTIQRDGLSDAGMSIDGNIVATGYPNESGEIVLSYSLNKHKNFYGAVTIYVGGTIDSSHDQYIYVK